MAESPRDRPEATGPADPPSEQAGTKQPHQGMPLGLGGGGYGGGDRTVDALEKKPDPGEDTRPEQGGEAATTRFGMEEGDNSDIPASAGGTADQEAERST